VADSAGAASVGLTRACAQLMAKKLLMAAKVAAGLQRIISSQGDYHF
jgi:hypothetical protein